MSKKQYREFCLKEKSIPIFSRSWWLDTVCGENGWDVCLIDNGNEITASMPYFTRKKYGLTYLTMPPFTQTLGPYIKYPEEQKYEKRLAHEKKLMTRLIEKLPPFAYFNQNFNYTITNWLPFYWKGFHQTTRYTYIINNLQDREQLWKNVSESTRRQVRKAEKKVAVETTDNIDQFYEINKMTFKRQDLSVPYTLESIQKLDQACKNNNSRKIFLASDSENKIHAALYLVWDERSAYYLIGGGDPELRNSGAASLLMWEAILFSSGVTEKFDFEGSMLESVERFFRSFGAQQKPYFRISKTNSGFLKLVNRFR